MIHNAPFDLGFLDYEYRMLDRQQPAFSEQMRVLDTLLLARELHPGQRNSLDALCKRYEVDNSNRSLHGALLDAEILAEVYLAMTGGQVDLGLSLEPVVEPDELAVAAMVAERPALKVVRASSEEAAPASAALAGHPEEFGAMPVAGVGTGPRLCAWLRAPPCVLGPAAGVRGCPSRSGFRGSDGCCSRNAAPGGRGRSHSALRCNTAFASACARLSLTSRQRSGSPPWRCSEPARVFQVAKAHVVGRQCHPGAVRLG